MPASTTTPVAASGVPTMTGSVVEGGLGTSALLRAVTTSFHAPRSSGMSCGPPDVFTTGGAATGVAAALVLLRTGWML